DSVYFLVETLDHILSKDDYAMIYLSAADEEALGGGSYRFKLAHDGLKQTSAYTNGWTNSSLDVNAKSNFKGTLDANFDRDHGYIVELSIPRSKLTIKSGQLLVNFALHDSGNGEDALANTNETSTTKWIPITGIKN